MKAHHFIILFATFFLTVVSVIGIRSSNVLKSVSEFSTVERKVEASLQDSIQMIELHNIEAVNNLNTLLDEANAKGDNKVLVSTLKNYFTDGKNIFKDNNRMLNTFFSSFYSSMGIMGNKTEENLISQHMPVFALIDNKGIYVNYCKAMGDSTNESGYTSIYREWSAGFPYSYSDDAAIYTFTLDGRLTVINKETYKVNEYDYNAKTGESGAPRQVLNSAGRVDNRAVLNQYVTDSNTVQFAMEVIHNTMERIITYYVNEYNYAGFSSDYNYLVQLPNLDKDSNLISGIGVLAIYCPRPYGGGTSLEKPIPILSYVPASVDEYFVITQNISSGFLEYHALDCISLSDSTPIIGVYATKRESARHGAYECKICKP